MRNKYSNPCKIEPVNSNNDQNSLDDCYFDDDEGGNNPGDPSMNHQSLIDDGEEDGDNSNPDDFMMQSQHHMYGRTTLQPPSILNANGVNPSNNNNNKIRKRSANQAYEYLTQLPDSKTFQDWLSRNETDFTWVHKRNSMTNAGKKYYYICNYRIKKGYTHYLYLRI